MANAAEKYSYEHSEELMHLIDWHDYSQQTFNKAQKENKPIFLVISAVWCYWCHVYESEDFLFNENVYPFLNENFIPIFIDSDKRPGLTRQYLEGGWPSTTILTPSGKRITGFSGPREVHQLLLTMQQTVAQVQGKEFKQPPALDYSKLFIVIPTPAAFVQIQQSYLSIIQRSHDSIFGGFGDGQKFPQGLTLHYMLEQYQQTQNIQFLDLVAKTFDSQFTDLATIKTGYNLYDPVDGGFHRYGTKRDWSPPHFEKMLVDNARLLRAYAKLYSITNNDKHKEVVDKTAHFITTKLLSNGQFYGSIDADEEIYYELQRERQPFIDTTTYTNWAAETVVSFFDISKELNDYTYKKTAIEALDFLTTNMITKNGALHFYTDQAQLDGQLTDNAWLLLALIRAHEETQDEQYLKLAQQIADYSTDNLYDWNSGGFFERNSKDKTRYTAFDTVSIHKPFEENGVMIYALAKLYEITDNTNYLNAAVKSFGRLQNDLGQLDRSYYFVKSAEFMQQNNFLAEFQQHQAALTQLDEKQQKDFWLNSYIETSTRSPPFFLFLIIALFAGILSFASPCSLPIVPHL